MTIVQSRFHIRAHRESGKICRDKALIVYNRFLPQITGGQSIAHDERLSSLTNVWRKLVGMSFVQENQ